MRYLLIAVLLSGCALKELQDEMFISRYAGTCTKLGYVAGTTDFRECQTRLLSAR